MPNSISNNIVGNIDTFNDKMFFQRLNILSTLYDFSFFGLLFLNRQLILSLLGRSQKNPPSVFQI